MTSVILEARQFAIGLHVGAWSSLHSVRASVHPRGAKPLNCVPVDRRDRPWSGLKSDFASALQEK